MCLTLTSFIPILFPPQYCRESFSPILLWVLKSVRDGKGATGSHGPTLTRPTVVIHLPPGGELGLRTTRRLRRDHTDPARTDSGRVGPQRPTPVPGRALLLPYGHSSLSPESGIEKVQPGSWDLVGQKGQRSLL